MHTVTEKRSNPEHLRKNLCSHRRPKSNTYHQYVLLPLKCSSEEKKYLEFLGSVDGAGSALKVTP